MPLYITGQEKLDANTSGTTLGLTAADGNYVHLSLRDWPNQALLKRIRVRCNSNGVTGNIDIKILSNPAGYRAAAAPVNEDFVYAAWNNEAGVGAPATTWVIDERFPDGVLVEDATQTNHFHIYLESEGLVGAAAPTFDVEVWGEALHDDKIVFSHSNYDNVVWVKTVADTYTDLTYLARTAHITYPLAANGFTAWVTAATDYLYIGAWAPFTRAHFDIATAATGGRALTAQYLRSDSTWQALTVLDCTDAIPSGTATPFNHSGVVYWTAPAAWVRQTLPAGDGTPPDTSAVGASTGWTAGSGRPRYWVRLTVDDVTNGPTFRSIRVIAT